jgi:hypothetical protein
VTDSENTAAKLILDGNVNLINYNLPFSRRFVAFETSYIYNIVFKHPIAYTNTIRDGIHGVISQKIVLFNSLFIPLTTHTHKNVRNTKFADLGEITVLHRVQASYLLLLLWRNSPISGLGLPYQIPPFEA